MTRLTALDNYPCLKGRWSVLWLGIMLLAGNRSAGQTQEGPHAGPLFDHFDLTLEPGDRIEALGPLFYKQTSESQHTWALPPLFSHYTDSDTDSEEVDFLYPVVTYERFGEQYRWQLLQLLSLAGGPTQGETNRSRFTIFPIYFQQRSSDTNENYTALVPFYGHLKHRLLKDETFFVMFPVYAKTRKADVVTENYLYPFFHLRRGNQLRGWQFWPLVGKEHKDVTRQTNGFDEVQIIGGHDQFFALWPCVFDSRTGIGTENPLHQQGFLPVYTLERSPKRDATTVLWPFFSKIDDRDKKYREWHAPWPAVVFARGEGKTTSRIWPLFGQAHSSSLESDFYLWPIYKYNRLHSDPLDRRRTRICFFLYSDLTQRNTETGASLHRADFWPFFSIHRDFNGNTRFQTLALLEPFLPASHKIDRDYSPLWALWRSEHNAVTGASSQSLLWNLFRRQTTPHGKKSSLLFGLFQYESGSDGKRARLFYIPIGKTKATGQPELSAKP